MLLVGPTGAGKSFLARRIYELKRSRHQLDGRFVEVNCATLRGDGAMSALFGHVKGAFTGAQNAREGLLRAADGGMLFLDEIGELGADEQAMLLKAIEEKRPSRWVRTVRWRATSSLSPGPTATCADEWPKACSARTCSPASTFGPSSCRAWLDAARTSSRTSTSNWSGTPASKGGRCVST